MALSRDALDDGVQAVHKQKLTIQTKSAHTFDGTIDVRKRSRLLRMLQEYIDDAFRDGLRSYFKRLMPTKIRMVMIYGPNYPKPAAKISLIS